MSTTYELLSMLEDQYPGWLRDGPRGLLRYLNEAQRVLCHVAAQQLLIYNEVTGELPALNTVQGTRRYYASDETGYINNVLMNVEDARFTTLMTLNFQDYGRINPNAHVPQYRNISGIRYVRIPFVRTWPATESENAKILFTTDPGTSTNYQVEGYRRAVNLDSDSIELTVPPPYDELYLLPAAAKLVEGVNNGNYIEARAAIIKEFRPLMQDAFNEGEQGVDFEPERRGF